MIFNSNLLMSVFLAFLIVSLSLARTQPPPTRSANQFAVQTTVRLLLELSQTNDAVAASLRAGIEYALGIVGQARVVSARRFESQSQTRQEKEKFLKFICRISAMLLSFFENSVLPLFQHSFV
jgi:hypothetical protein